MHPTIFHKGIHVSHEDVYDAHERCPVCLCKEQRRACLRIQDDPVIDMLSCERCRACSASHMPKPELLDRYYAQYYAKVTDNYTFDNPERFARHLSAALKPRTDRPLRMLDFGGGDGSLAIALVQRFQEHVAAHIPIEIDVVDYERPRKSLMPNVVVTGHRDINDVDGSYDVLLASAILEHIPDAHSAIRKLIGMARPGAFMYARTPYIIPLAKLVPKLDTTYPAHVHDMGGEFWNRFIETFNLNAQVLISRPSPVETTFLKWPVRTILAHVLKFPARVELWALGQRRTPRWKLVGGWEVILHFF